MRAAVLFLVVAAPAALPACATTITPFVRDVHQTPEGRIVVERCVLVKDAWRGYVAEDCHLEDASLSAARAPLLPDAPVAPSPAPPPPPAPPAPPPAPPGSPSAPY